MVRILLWGIAALFAFIPSVLAADFGGRVQAPAPVANWTGFYVGAHFGWLNANWDGTLTYDEGSGPVSGIFDPAARSINGNGIVGGGQIGFNHQIGMLVWGAEVDWGASALNGKGEFAAIGPATGYMWTIKNEVDWVSTERGRLGLTVLDNSLLIYGTGGVAAARAVSKLTATADQRQGFDGIATTAVGEASHIHVGWVAGGGVEYLLSQNWTMRLEYLYMDLGSADYRLNGTAYPGKPACNGAPSPNCSFPHTTDSFPSSLRLQTVRAAVNYKF